MEKKMRVIEDNEGNVEVEWKSIFKRPQYILSILPIILILITTLGMIIFIGYFYISDTEEAIYNEGFKSGMNITNYYMHGLNDGYELGQEEIITRINKNLEIPVLYEQNGNLTVNWISLSEVCGI